MAASTVLALSMILTATALLSTSERAWKTFPKLPLPRRRPNWYLPKRVAPAEGDDGGVGGGGGTPGSMAGGLEKKSAEDVNTAQQQPRDYTETKRLCSGGLVFIAYFLFLCWIPGGVSIFFIFPKLPLVFFFLILFISLLFAPYNL